MRSILYLCVLIVLVGCKNTAQGQIKLVTTEEAQALLEKEEVQLIDVRTLEEYKEGFISNAVNIDFLASTFLENIQQLDKEKPIIVYCRSGKRSANSSKVLEEVGFKEIYDLEGGIMKWQEKKLEIQAK